MPLEDNYNVKLPEGRNPLMPQECNVHRWRCTTSARQSSAASTDFVPLQFMKDKPTKASLHDDQETTRKFSLDSHVWGVRVCGIWAFLESCMPQRRLGTFIKRESMLSAAFTYINAFKVGGVELNHIEKIICSMLAKHCKYLNEWMQPFLPTWRGKVAYQMEVAQCQTLKGNKRRRHNPKTWTQRQRLSCNTHNQDLVFDTLTHPV